MSFMSSLNLWAAACWMAPVPLNPIGLCLNQFCMHSGKCPERLLLLSPNNLLSLVPLRTVAYIRWQGSSLFMCLLAKLDIEMCQVCVLLSTYCYVCKAQSTMHGVVASPKLLCQLSATVMRSISMLCAVCNRLLQLCNVICSVNGQQCWLFQLSAQPFLVQSFPWASAI